MGVVVWVWSVEAADEMRYSCVNSVGTSSIGRCVEEVCCVSTSRESSPCVCGCVCVCVCVCVGVYVCVCVCGGVCV